MRGRFRPAGARTTSYCAGRFASAIATTTFPGGNAHDRPAPARRRQLEDERPQRPVDRIVRHPRRRRGRRRRPRRGGDLPAVHAGGGRRRAVQRTRRSPSARRTATPMSRAPTPATFPHRCSRIPARNTSSSAIPSAAPTMAKPTRWFARKRPPCVKVGLTAIVCVGETKDERVAGRASEIVGGQLDGSLDADFDANCIVVAYEPVWAIGTGLTPTAADVAEIHAFIRAQAGKAVRPQGRARPHPLRRLRKTLERGRTDGREERRRRAGRRREPEVRGLHGDRGRLQVGSRRARRPRRQRAFGKAAGGAFG